MAMTHTFPKNEEIANAITHGIGFLLSIAALVLLIINAVNIGSIWYIVSFSVYGGTMILLFLSSTLVHSFPKGKAKDLFEIFDHSAIYLFIAGTYTPIVLTVLRGPLGWTIFAIVWTLAIAGVIFKVFFVKKFLYTSTFIYILMGWLVVFAWKPLTISLPSNCLYFLVIGGIFYTFGTIFYIWRSFPYHHAVWHMFVIAGSIFHFFAIVNIA
ncbi:PAQR family membrane homeostasis protein TrhA [Bacillus alveayuensis]|uniref:Hemolysin III n=1 Tax=Aeribacillus alveayuensis TaxID=279215 RepID=A0ABT9VMI8_9BACI|nr:hemolysin III family protein [Bacillus alveayuensis]MDQ0162190.1 hemolysin III [Bacillus alveayuensis]